LFHQISSCINTLGVDGTIKALQKAVREKYTNESVSFIVSTVTDVIGISVDDLLSHTIRDDRRKITIGFCSYFLSKEYQFSYSFISESLPFNLGNRAVWKYCQVIKKAKIDKPKSEVDQMIAMYYQEISDIIINHKKSQPSNEKPIHQKKQRQTAIRA
jgi:hypothetical protein